jgi:hypothetical protein
MLKLSCFCVSIEWITQLISISAHTHIYMNINLYENKSGHNEHIYFIIKLYENKPGHYKHIYFNIKRCENKSGHYCNLGNDWSHWTLTGFPFIPFVSLVNSVLYCYSLFLLNHNTYRYRDMKICTLFTIYTDRS